MKEKEIKSLNNQDFFFVREEENRKNKVTALRVKIWNICIYFVVAVKEMGLFHLYNKIKYIRDNINLYTWWPIHVQSLLYHILFECAFVPLSNMSILSPKGHGIAAKRPITILLLSCLDSESYGVRKPNGIESLF